ncbi:MAG: MXAN_2562 family outer membrane beta-barrel protein [Deltaproteobacteria bacterium]
MIAAGVVAAAGWTRAAEAQKPTIVPDPLPEASKRLNIAEIEANARIPLSWIATFNAGVIPGTGESYSYQLTYDNFVTAERAELRLITVEDVEFGAEAEDRQDNGARVTVYVLPQDLVAGFDREDASDLPPPLGTGADNMEREVFLKVYADADETDEFRYQTFTWQFEYDTRPPPQPTVTKVEPGENRLQLSWEISDDADVATYNIVYCPDISALDVDEEMLMADTATTGGVLPCAQPTVGGTIDGMFGSAGVQAGLAVGVKAALAVRAVDEAGNVGPLSNVVIAEPVPVSDFWELYKESGGAEEGGFCFIATAAHGSYAHPAVQVLRWFRDAVLIPAPGGRAIVDTYYRWSPPMARRVAADEDLAAATRVALVFGVLLALAALAMLGFGAGFVVVAVARRVKLAWAAALLVLLIGSTAEARRPDSTIESFGLGYEFKGGPYLPDLGNTGGGTEGNTAFQDIFESNPNELFTIGLDVQLYRGIGTAGVGASFGFMQFVGRGRYASGENVGEIAQDTTVFNIAPLTLTGFYRFDWLADQIPLPFVPYVKGGLAYYVWWVTTGTGDVARFEQPGNGADDLAGRGGKFGLTGTVGMAIMLNVFEPASAQSLHAATGVRGTYLFGELQANKIDGFGSAGFDLSDVTWNIGLYLEM